MVGEDDRSAMGLDRGWRCVQMSPEAPLMLKDPIICPVDSADLGKSMCQEVSSFAWLMDLQVIVLYIQDGLEQFEFFIVGDLLEGVKKGECLMETMVSNLNTGGSTSSSMFSGEVEQFVNKEVKEIEPLEVIHVGSKGKGL
jgi:hypothetical protein